MRTPLTRVLGFTKLIRGQLERTVWPALPADHAKAAKARATITRNLAIVAEDGERLLQLIDDVLLLSQLDGGMIRWQLERHAPAALVERAVAAVQARFDRRPDVTLATQIADELPRVRTDAERVHQVLLNLLTNAEKFTEAGALRVPPSRVVLDPEGLVWKAYYGQAVSDHIPFGDVDAFGADRCLDMPEQVALG